MTTCEAGGGAPFGNFHNYYQFNKVEDRLQFIDGANLFVSAATTKILTILDVGCNEGDLMLELLKLAAKEITGCSCSVQQIVALGVDIDPVLISRARAKAGEHLQKMPIPITLEFLAGDVMNPQFVESHIRSFVRQYGFLQFDFVSCFSLTMWIHIYHGDDGLRRFIETVTRLGRYVMVEPQPWKCYKALKRRHQRLKLPIPGRGIDTLRLRGPMLEQQLDACFCEAGCTLVRLLGETAWERKVSWYSTPTVGMLDDSVAALNNDKACTEANS